VSCNCEGTKYQGKYCDEEMPCEVQCENNGTLIGQFRSEGCKCDCTEGYQGATCEKKIETCADVITCDNGGEPALKQGHDAEAYTKATCECNCASTIGLGEATTFTGPRCEQPIKCSEPRIGYKSKYEY